MNGMGGEEDCLYVGVKCIEIHNTVLRIELNYCYVSVLCTKLKFLEELCFETQNFY